MFFDSAWNESSVSNPLNPLTVAAEQFAQLEAAFVNSQLSAQLALQGVYYIDDLPSNSDLGKTRQGKHVLDRMKE